MNTIRNMEIYSKEASKPRLANAWFGREEDEFVIMSKNEEFDGDKSKWRKTLSFVKGSSLAPPISVDVKLVSMSPKGDTYAVVREEDETCRLEIWCEGGRCVVPKLTQNAHGKKIYTDNQTGKNSLSLPLSLFSHFLSRAPIHLFRSLIHNDNNNNRRSCVVSGRSLRCLCG